MGSWYGYVIGNKYPLYEGRHIVMYINDIDKSVLAHLNQWHHLYGPLNVTSESEAMQVLIVTHRLNPNYPRYYQDYSFKYPCP